MGALVSLLVGLYQSVFGAIERFTNGWLLGLAARFVFAGVLLVYFLDSALTKLGSGIFGFLSPGPGAYVQVFPKLMESVSYDPSQVSFFPYGLIVLLGMWAELILPFLVVLGLFTRVASLGMIVFIIVMSYVDIFGHNVEAATIGALFDNTSGSLILDQRLLWIFVLLVLVLKGPGMISLDTLFGRMYRRTDY